MRRTRPARAARSIVMLVALLGACTSPADVVISRIFGTVTVNGEPTPGLTVEIRHNGKLVGGTLVTAQDGSFGIFGHLERGTYRVTLLGIPEGITFPETTKTTELTNEEAVEVNFSGTAG